jgi:hypothetical protein
LQSVSTLETCLSMIFISMSIAYYIWK